MRLAVRSLLQADGMEVVGEADNEADAVRFVQEADPDVILTDLSLRSNGTGIAVCREAKRANLDAKVLVFSASFEKRDVLASAAAGADGFADKGMHGSDLATTVRRVLAGERIWLLSNEAGATIDPVLTSVLRANLTKREREVLVLLIYGFSDRAISERHHTSVATVKTHVQHLFRKLGLSSRRELL